MFFFLCFSFYVLIPAAVNQSNGNMYFTQELFTASGNSVALPIDLNYSAGIKVDQRSTWVGLGFDLSLPYIDRVPQGSVDEKAAEFLPNGSPAADYWFYSYKTYNKLLMQNSNGYLQNPPKGNFTNDQDFYALNAHFANGRIIFATPASNDVPMKAYLQNYRPLKIEYKIDANDNIYEWDITDENGNIYIFGGTQGIVKARTNPEVYNENTVISMSRTSTNWSDAWDGATITPTGCHDNACKKKVPVKTVDHYVNQTFNSRWYLTEIRTPNYNQTHKTGEHIVINYSTPASAFKIADLFSFASEQDKAVTSIFKYIED